MEVKAVLLIACSTLVIRNAPGGVSLNTVTIWKPNCSRFSDSIFVRLPNGPVAEWSGFQMVLAAILFWPFENQTNESGFQMFWTVLYIQYNPSHLKTGRRVGFSKAGSHLVFSIWNPDTKSVQKMTIWIPDSPVFGCWLYFDEQYFKVIKSDDFDLL
jgi:hypothetical protein